MSSEFTKRLDDMSRDTELCVGSESNGDIYLMIYKKGIYIRNSQVEFVGRFGDTRSPHTRKALYNLLEAIKKDNKENPIDPSQKDSY